LDVRIDSPKITPSVSHVATNPSSEEALVAAIDTSDGPPPILYSMAFIACCLPIVFGSDFDLALIKSVVLVEVWVLCGDYSMLEIGKELAFAFS